ncbi:MAG: hypothetical protein FWH27_00630 [Planctomycetaceae bacterium]|nr:hypothetical protein [Planctomycetaceae bacterium]
MRKIQNENRSMKDKNDYTGPMFTIRWKWLLGTFAFMAVLGAAVVTVYFFRTKDQTEFRIQVLRDKEEAGRWREGIRQLALYQQEKPNDVDVLRALAEVYDRNGIGISDWRNAANYYQLLLAHVASDEERLEALEKLLDNQRKSSDSEGMFSTIQTILAMTPEHPAAWRCLVIVRTPMLSTGVYQPGTGEPGFFDLLVKKALELNPNDAGLVNTYSRLLRSDKKNDLDCTSQEFRNTPLATRTAEADARMAELVKNNPDSPEALLMDYEYRRYFRLLDPEATELDEALVKVQQLDPNNPVAMMYAGMFYEQKALRMKYGQSPDEYPIHRQEAIDRFEQMIQAAPFHPAGYLQLNTVYELDSEREKQIEILEKGNKALNSGNLAILVPLVSAYLENNDPKNAERCIRQIQDLAERNRGMIPADSLGIMRQIATLLEGQTLAISGQPMEAIAKFRSVFEPTIPRRIEIRLVYTSLMIHAQLLVETVNLDSAVGIYEQTIRYLESEAFTDAPMNFSRLENFTRLDRAYLSHIAVLRLLGYSGNVVTAAMNRYVEFLHKELATSPDNQMIRLALASALFQQTVELPADRRNWSELDQLLEILQHPASGPVVPPWQVDFLQASVTWEKLGRSRSNIEEVLMPLRVAENKYNADVTFLVALEDAYHNYNSSKDCDRVLEQIRVFPDGLPYWYLIKAMRAEQLGNALEAKRLIDEAMTELPEALKGVFLSVQKTLELSLEESKTSIVRERQTLERLRLTNADNPTIPTLFQQGLMELDFGNTAAVAQVEIELRKLEGKDGTLSLFLEAERLLQEAVDGNDPKIESARAHQQMLVRKRPNWEYTYLLTSDMEDKAGNEKGVAEALARAIEMGNRDPVRYRDLIELYRKAGQEDRAQAVFARGITMFPNLMAGFHLRLDPPFQTFFVSFNRAIRRDDVDVAKQIAGQWLALAEKNNVDPREMAVFYSIIAQSLYNIDQLEVAEQYFFKAAESGGETMLPLARYLAETGKMQEAMDRIYTEMTRSETPEVFLLPVLALMRDYDYDPAWVEPFDTYVHKVQPSQITDNGKLSQYIEYWVIRGKNDLALPFYRRLNELSANSANILNDLAYLTAFQETDDSAVREANINEGLNLINKAITLEETNVNLVDTKGLIVLLQDRPAEAVPLFRKAAELSNQAIIYRLHLAVALLRSQEKDLAQEEFAGIREMLVPQIDLLPESNQNYTRELLDAFPEEN